MKIFEEYLIMKLYISIRIKEIRVAGSYIMRPRK